MEPSQPPGRDFGRLIGRRTGPAGDRPLITWYDGALGQRVELSWKTFENWVAKTANLLVDELGLEPGDRVASMLDAHWQAPVVLAACWRAGVSVVPAGAGVDGDAAAELLAGAGCAACFVHEDLLALVPERFAAAGRAPALVAVTGDLLGRGTVDLGGAMPLGRLVPGMPDDFDPGGDLSRAEALLLAGGDGAGGWTQAELLEAGASLGERLGVDDADRLDSGLDLDSAAGVIAGLVLPLLRGSGIVLERRLEAATAWKRLSQERVALAALTGGQVGALRAAGPPGDDLDLGRLRALVCPTEAGGAAVMEAGPPAPGIRLMVTAFVPDAFRHRSGAAET